MVTTWSSCHGRSPVVGNNAKFQAEIPLISTVQISRATSLDALQSICIADAKLEEEKQKKLSENILSNEQLDIESYEKLIDCIPFKYIEYPADISVEKRLRLVSADKIELNKKSFDASVSDSDLVTHLILSNEQKFHAKIDEYPVNDEIQLALLYSEFKIETKLAIIQRRSLDSLKGNASLAEVIFSIIRDEKADLSGIDISLIDQALSSCSNSVDKVAILTRFSATEKNTELMRFIAKLDHPLNNIAERGKRPRIPNTKINQNFAAALKASGAISSYTSNDDYIQITTLKDEQGK